jgi:hypothetical protein
MTDKINWQHLRTQKKEAVEQRVYILSLYVETATSGRGPPHYRGLTITFSYGTPHSVGLLWASDQPNAEIST